MVSDEECKGISVGYCEYSFTSKEVKIHVYV